MLDLRQLQKISWQLPTAYYQKEVINGSQMKKTTKANKTTKGFSLPELLVVVAIIAVLVACSVPIFAQKLEDSRRAVDLRTAQIIRSGISQVLNDGTLSFKKENMGMEFRVVRNGVNYGLCNGNWNDILVNGKPYKTFENDIWPYLRKTGISNNMKIKRTDPELKWFGVIVYGNGESYYYEGIGDPGALGTREVVEYEWSELE